jgi:hypothetical protein
MNYNRKREHYWIINTTLVVFSIPVITIWLWSYETNYWPSAPILTLLIHQVIDIHYDVKTDHFKFTWQMFLHTYVQVCFRHVSFLYNVAHNRLADTIRVTQRHRQETEMGCSGQGRLSTTPVPRRTIHTESVSKPEFLLNSSKVNFCPTTLKSETLVSNFSFSLPRP